MKEFIEKLKADTIMAASRTNQCADGKDVNRNHVNYGTTTAYANVLRELGHEVDIPVWEDESGCLRIPKLNINGKILEF
jgi:hypothetical protein